MSSPEPLKLKAKAYCLDCKKMVTTHEVKASGNDRIFVHCDECTRWLP